MRRFALIPVFVAIFSSIHCEKTMDIVANPPQAIPPEVEITSPSDGDTVNDTVTIHASITNAVEVSRIDFYLDDNLLGSDDSEPFELEWDTREAGDGDHTLHCTATDTGGNESVSESIEVTVSNAPPISIEEVDFDNDDGFRIAGTLFRVEGAEIGIVMAHSGVLGQSQVQLQPLASQLADSGFTVLTFDLRGYGRTGGFPAYGRVHIDVRAAIDYLRDLGYTSIGSFGVGLGAFGSAITAQDENVSGLVLISCPISVSPPFIAITEDDMSTLTYPKLIIAAEDDFANFRPFAAYAQTIYDYCIDPRELVIFSGPYHSMELFESEHADELNRLLIDFFMNLR